MMIVIWLIIGLVVYYLYKNNTNINIDRENDAVEILKQRFVKGEIDDVTYNKMIKLIKEK